MRTMVLNQVRPWAATLLVFCAACAVHCGDDAPQPPAITELQPSQIAGGTATTLTLLGTSLSQVTEVRVGGLSLIPEQSSATQLSIEVPALPRGSLSVITIADGLSSDPVELTVLNSVPCIEPPGPQLVEVGGELRVQLETSDFDGDPLTLSAMDLPQGARLEQASQQVIFVPDAMQGDRSYEATLVVDDGLDQGTQTLQIEVVSVLPPLLVLQVSPNPAPGGRAFELQVQGGGFSSGTEVWLDGAALPTEVRSAVQLIAQAPPLARGTYPISLHRRTEATEAMDLEVLNAPPSIEVPERLVVAEETQVEAVVTAEDMDGDPVRLALFDLPPGARFDASSGQLSFRPDFIQGGRTFEVQAMAFDGTDTSTQTFTIEVEDSIQPPWPEVVSTESRGDYRLIVLRQVTDDFLDSPGHAGRSLEARVSIPTGATEQVPYPVRVFLHGLGGSPYTGGRGDQFRIYPHDPDNTYWWGYSSAAPKGGLSSPVPPYTARRVLHLLEWLLLNYPAANPEQVYLNGSSMGGAGAGIIGLLWARHFAMIETTIGQKIARNHRPSRINQLSGHYGSPQDGLLDDMGMPVWDRLDMVRALADLPEAQQQFIFSRHAKDDPTIHFGAAVFDSPLVQLSWLQALQAFKVGHFAVWDEGAHGPADPVMGTLWWDGGWNRMSDGETYLNRNQAFAAFSRSAIDDDPGDGSGNGQQPWHEERGFAGSQEVPGDTGWSGDRVGTFNRYLRWDSRNIVDTWNRFSIPLRAKVGDGDPPPQAGYPPRGDRFDGALPIVADVTPRRVQRFICDPGESVAWSFGSLAGQVIADDQGVITVPQLPLTDTWTTLELSR